MPPVSTMARITSSGLHRMWRFTSTAPLWLATTGLAEALGISYGEAESIKVGIPGEVQSPLETLVLPLGRELRASMDCFEHQQDRPITQVFVSGATAKSDLIIQTLRAELMVECKSWNPLSFLQLALPPEQTAKENQENSRINKPCIFLNVLETLFSFTH